MVLLGCLWMIDSDVGALYVAPYSSVILVKLPQTLAPV
jgi:hypothetical protein